MSKGTHNDVKGRWNSPDFHESQLQLQYRFNNIIMTATEYFDVKIYYVIGGIIQEEKWIEFETS